MGGALLESGAHMNTVFLSTFVQLMTLHPEVRKRAQREIDQVVGSGRSPVLGDIDNAPYIRAVIKEVRSSAQSFSRAVD